MRWARVLDDDGLVHLARRESGYTALLCCPGSFSVGCQCEKEDPGVWSTRRRNAREREVSCVLCLTATEKRRRRG